MGARPKTDSPLGSRATSHMDNGTTPDDLTSHLLRLGLGDSGSFEGSSSLCVSGDYYRSEDEATRGTILGSGPGEAMQSAFLKVGDFYGVEDNVVRGVTFEPAMGSDSFGMGEPFGLGGFADAPFGLDPKPKGFPSSGFAAEFPGSHSLSTPTTYFSAGDCFLSPPDDEFFSFAQTTLYLLCDEPYILGNCVLDFLMNEVTASVTKVNRAKFCIKADVFINNVMTTTKIRFWQHESAGRVALEFQRRGGDCITFNGVYQRASKYLQSRFTSIGNNPPAVAETFFAPPPLPFAPPPLSLSPPPLSKGDAMDLEIEPILDMAAQTNDAFLQAESATALANICEQEQNAASLCTPSAIKAITALLSVDTAEVALPTANLLLSLARCYHATPYFIGQEPSQGFLDLCIEKLCARLTCTLVRRNLAKALATALHACAAQLSHGKAQKIAACIDTAMRATSKERLSEERPGAAADIDAIDQCLREGLAAMRPVLGR